MQDKTEDLANKASQEITGWMKNKKKLYQLPKMQK